MSVPDWYEINAEWLKTRVEFTESCWLWKAFLDKDGYGLVKFEGRTWRAHRLIYALTVGDPEGFFVCHDCDVPQCVNPEHLYLGTPKSNMEDKVRRGRSHGQKKTHCKRGHAFDHRNTYVSPTGIRQCRTCDRDKHRRAYQS